MVTQEEIWKHVVGYEGLYEVSDLGRIRSLDRSRPHSRNANYSFLCRGKIRKIHNDKNGYQRVTLCKGGRQSNKQVHRIVGYAFLGLTDDLQIDHVDGDPKNNRLDNLRTATGGQNMIGSRRKHKGATSQYRGVSWHDRDRRWVAQIQFNRTNFYLGCYSEEIDAAKAFDKKAIELGFENEALNFPKL